MLIASSYSFYVLWSGWFALLLLARTLIAFYAARRARSRYPRRRYFDPGAVQVAAFDGDSGARSFGVSYYTFKLGAYLIDVHWGALEPERAWSRSWLIRRFSRRSSGVRFSAPRAFFRRSNSACP